MVSPNAGSSGTSKRKTGRASVDDQNDACYLPPGFIHIVFLNRQGELMFTTICMVKRSKIKGNYLIAGSINI